MLFENPPKNIESLIAKSADLTNKPFVHAVVKISGEYEFEEEDIDLIKTFIEPCLNSLLSNPSSPNLECSSCNLLILDGLNLNGKRTLLALTEGFSSLKGI